MTTMEREYDRYFLEERDKKKRKILEITHSIQNTSNKIISSRIPSPTDYSTLQELAHSLHIEVNKILPYLPQQPPYYSQYQQPPFPFYPPQQSTIPRSPQAHLYPTSDRLSPPPLLHHSEYSSPYPQAHLQKDHHQNNSQNNYPSGFPPVTNGNGMRMSISYSPASSGLSPMMRAGSITRTPSFSSQPPSPVPVSPPASPVEEIAQPSGRLSPQDNIAAGGSEFKEFTNIINRSRRSRKSKMMKGRRNRACEWCNTAETPEWRVGPNDITLCNACGLQYRYKLKQEQNAKKKNSIQNILN